VLLTASGDAPSGSGISNAVLLGTRWYAFNYVNGVAADGGKNRLLCFDTATGAACADQP
jgi:hypothetical protein